MPSRSGKTDQFVTRPSIEVIEELKAIYEKCYKPSPNALGVDLLEAGLEMLLDKNSPPAIPKTILDLRARLRGEAVEQQPSPDVSREVVFQLVREALAELGVKPATAESALQAVQETGHTAEPAKPKRPAK